MNARGYEGQIVWIVGASSGIGRALASELARRGASLALSARRQDELECAAADLDSAHKIFPLDVTDSEACARAAAQIREAFGRIDRVIFLAAIYAPMTWERPEVAAVKHVIEVNLTGAFHVIHAVLPGLLEQGTGQIALCGSVAGYAGLPGGQPYSATKAGIINAAESLRAELPRSFDVKLINPGFVRTRLTDKNSFRMPMIVSPEQAAACIAEGLLTPVFEVHFPKGFTRWMKLLRALPYALLFRITSKFAP